jgi:hypothetical protein
MTANTAAGINISEWVERNGVRDCLQWFTREKQWINEIHLQLCRVPALTFMEQERAAWFLEQFRAAGWDASIDRAGNVVAATGRSPYVALTAHLDTVIAPRNKDEITVEGDGRFCGPGVADNGAGLAALLAVARLWKNCPKLPDLPRGLLLVANVGEEGEGNLLPVQAVAAGWEGWSVPCSGRRGQRPHHHPRARQPPLRDPLSGTRRP